jgi:hypothetical protein
MWGDIGWMILSVGGVELAQKITKRGAEYHKNRDNPSGTWSNMKPPPNMKPGHTFEVLVPPSNSTNEEWRRAQQDIWIPSLFALYPDTVPSDPEWWSSKRYLLFPCASGHHFATLVVEVKPIGDVEAVAEVRWDDSIAGTKAPDGTMKLLRDLNTHIQKTSGNSELGLPLDKLEPTPVVIALQDNNECGLVPATVATALATTGSMRRLAVNGASLRVETTGKLLGLTLTREEITLSLTSDGVGPVTKKVKTGDGGPFGSITGKMVAWYTKPLGAGETVCKEH